MSRIPTSSRNTPKTAVNVAPLSRAPLTRIATVETVGQLPNVLNKRAMVRRSKSMSELRPIRAPLSSKAPVKTQTVMNPRAPLVKGTKRAAPIPADAPQKKIIKKIPDWDYKTRFNTLKEDHKKLVEEHKEARERLTVEAKINQDFRKNNETLSAQRNNAEKENHTLKTQVVKLVEENSSLKNKLQVEVSKCEDFHQKVETLTAEKDDVEKQNNILQKQVLELSDAVLAMQKTQQENEQKIRELEQENSQLNKRTEELTSNIHKHEVKRRQLHNEVQDLKGNIRVFCRLRPPSAEEVLNQTVFNLPNDKTIEIPSVRDSMAAGRGMRASEKQEFSFDRVFDQEASQEDIFEELSQLVQSALDGYHVCVFAYGQTGSGKTHTMQGENYPEKLGMIPRSVELIFDIKRKMESMGWSYKLHASFLEIYNENVQDLLNISNGKTLDIRFNDGKGTTVSNLTIVPISTAEQFTQYMLKAQHNRFTAATNYNERSSRSHAVTKIYIEGFDGIKTTLTGSVSLVDLAGSESAKFSAEERLKETKHINKSLTCLGNVLMALHRKDTHIPYRDSKLTFLLQSTLGGNCKCLMIANISPNNDSYNETLNVLRFATKVKEVKTNVLCKNRVVQSIK